MDYVYFTEFQKEINNKRVILDLENKSDTSQEIRYLSNLFKTTFPVIVGISRLNKISKYSNIEVKAEIAHFVLSRQLRYEYAMQVIYIYIFELK